MPPYVKLTQLDGHEIHIPTPFAFGARGSEGSTVYAPQLRCSVKETSAEIAMLLGIGSADPADFAEVGEHPVHDHDRLVRIKRAAEAYAEHLSIAGTPPFRSTLEGRAHFALMEAVNAR